MDEFRNKQDVGVGFDTSQSQRSTTGISVLIAFLVRRI